MRTFLISFEFEKKAPDEIEEVIEYIKEEPYIKIIKEKEAKDLTLDDISKPLKRFGKVTKVRHKKEDAILYIPHKAQELETIFTESKKIYVTTPDEWITKFKQYNTAEGIQKKVLTHAVLILSLTKLAPQYAKSRRRIRGEYSWSYLIVPKVIPI